MKSGPFRPFETTWEDWVLGGGILRAFENPELPLEVEIGPGDDDFLLEQAGERPDRNWLGIEYSRKRVRRTARRVEQSLGTPGNLRLVWRPAVDVVGRFLTPARVHRYHIYFPDPWPKKHHHRYRLLAPEFLGDLRASLEPGGEVRFCTDHLEYGQETLAAFAEVGGWENRLPAPGYEILQPGDRLTVFEKRWREEGRIIHRLLLGRGT